MGFFQHLAGDNPLAWSGGVMLCVFAV